MSIAPPPGRAAAFKKGRIFLFTGGKTVCMKTKFPVRAEGEIRTRDERESRVPPHAEEEGRHGGALLR